MSPQSTPEPKTVRFVLSRSPEPVDSRWTGLGHPDDGLENARTRTAYDGTKHYYSTGTWTLVRQHIGPSTIRNTKTNEQEGPITILELRRD